MVKISKWIILGVGLVAAGLFFREAAGSSLSQTLARTGISGREVGGGIGAVGGGIGEFGVRLLDPFFSLGDLIKKYMNLFPAGEQVTQTATPAAAVTGGVSSGQVFNNPQADTDSSWFNPFPAAYAETQSTVGGTNIMTSVIDWGGGVSATLPLSEEARQWYQDSGVNAYVIDPNWDNGGGSNNTTGGGGGRGSAISANTAAAAGYGGGSIAGSVGTSTAGWGL